MTTIATDPPVSEKQRRAMFAAAAGHSTLDGKAKDMAPSKWAVLKRLFLEWINEEEAEPEHAGDELATAPNSSMPAGKPKGRAASILFTAPNGYGLFVKRADDEENYPGHWAWPGGKADGDEAFDEAAKREANEELGGDCSFDGMREMDRKRTPYGWDHVTYAVPVDEPFEPKLNREHSEHVWAPLDEPPSPLHPGVKASLDALAKLGKDAADPTGKLSETTREEINSQTHREDMPGSAFLGPDRTYPVKEERDGEWKYTRNLLLAAARRARMQGRGDLARRADEIRQREFGAEDAELYAKSQAGDATQLNGHLIPNGYWDWAMGEGKVGTGEGQLRMSRAVKSGNERLVSRTGNDMALDLQLAVDKRVYDKDGRMHVSQANIAKASVNEYLGSEINGVMKDEPGWEMLEPEKRYRLLRHPDEIDKAKDTFNGLPILWKHQPASADDHPSEITIGATGNESTFEYPYLKNSLSIWPAYASEAIEDGKQCQLSPGYAYKADMTPGEFEGEHFDGVMRDLAGNHIALVREGRQGSDVAVDHAPAWAAIERALIGLGAPEEFRA